MKIALLGAESTGKTRLAGELAAHMRQQGHSVAVVPEVLREWCERERRAPRPEEQLPIARDQEVRVDIAAERHAIVIADTTALMVLVYSGMLFEDGELARFALERQRRYNHTLLTALDLPWVADGLQREGPQVREPVDGLIRSELARAQVRYSVVYGDGSQRLRNALRALGQDAPRAQQSWTWMCEKCSDPACEHQLFTSKLRGRTPV
jgi:nicotinamide riboside kinase